MKLTPAQCRAGRGLLDMSQRQLAEASQVSLRTVTNFEARGGGIPATVQAIQRALEQAGVVFISENGGGPGVRLRDPLAPVSP